MLILMEIEIGCSFVEQVASQMSSGVLVFTFYTNKQTKKKTLDSFDCKTGAKSQQTGTNIGKRAQIRKSAHVCHISYRLEFVLRSAKRPVPAGNNRFYSFGREVQLLLQTFSIADLDFWGDKT